MANPNDPKPGEDQFSPIGLEDVEKLIGSDSEVSQKESQQADIDVGCADEKEKKNWAILDRQQFQPHFLLSEFRAKAEKDPRAKWLKEKNIDIGDVFISGFLQLKKKDMDVLIGCRNITLLKIFSECGLAKDAFDAGQAAGRVFLATNIFRKASNSLAGSIFLAKALLGWNDTPPRYIPNAGGNGDHAEANKDQGAADLLEYTKNCSPEAVKSFVDEEMKRSKEAKAAEAKPVESAESESPEDQDVCPTIKP